MELLGNQQLPGFPQFFVQTVSQPSPVLNLTEAEETAILATTTGAELHNLFPESLAECRERVFGEAGTPGRVQILSIIHLSHCWSKRFLARQPLALFPN